jgi:hypothetical protein
MSGTWAIVPSNIARDALAAVSEWLAETTLGRNGPSQYLGAKALFKCCRRSSSSRSARLARSAPHGNDAVLSIEI